MTQPLRIIYPYAGERHPLTVAGAPSEAEWFDVGGGPLAYHQLMCELWADAQANGCGLVVIEHDVVARPDIFETFATASDPWTSFPYRDICCWPCMNAWKFMLGCTLFSAELIASVPDAAASITNPAHLDWHNLCDGIGLNLEAAGFEHTWQFPSIVHHHDDRNGPAEDFLTDTRIPNDTPEEIAAIWLPPSTSQAQ